MNLPHKIMLIEDDHKLAQLLSDYLKNFNYEPHCFEFAAQGIEKIPQLQPDLIILDLMLPDMDGLTVLRTIRQEYQGKIFMLTASGDDMDQVAALELGVDDFVQKPIHPRVLLARLNRLLIPTNSTPDNCLIFGKLTINLALQRCSLDGNTLPLTPTEFNILAIMAEKPDHIFSREVLLKSVNGLPYDGINRVVDNKIAQLRKKLNDDAVNPKGIITVRGQGYKFISNYW